MAKLDPIIEFREDHRKVRDGLLDLAKAAEAGDVVKARNILGQIDTMVGPHFRYEEETLYPAMENYNLDIIIGKGTSAKTLQIKLPKFTLIAATTRISLLSSPFRSRFGVNFKLDFYQQKEIEKIIS